MYKPSSLAPGQYKDLNLLLAKELPAKGKFQARNGLRWKDATEYINFGEDFFLVQTKLRVAWCSQTLYLPPACDLQFLCCCYGIDSIYNPLRLWNSYYQKKCTTS